MYRAFSVVVVVASLNCSAAAQTFTTIDYPLATATFPQAIDGSNVVGCYQDSSGALHGYLCNGSRYTTLDDPSAVSPFGTSANGISGNYILGSYRDSITGHGFIYDGTNWTTIDDPLAVNGTYAVGMSGGAIVGNYYDSSVGSHGFLLNGTTFTTLDDPMGILGSTNITGISGDYIVGSFETTLPNTANAMHGFLYDGTNWTTLDDPLGIGTTNVTGIDGTNIVGYYYTYPRPPQTGSVAHSFLYNGTSWTAVGGNGDFAEAISGSTIVGHYGNPNQGFEVNVPEPSTLSLLCAGAIGLLVYGWRNRRCLGN